MNACTLNITSSVDSSNEVTIVYIARCGCHMHLEDSLTHQSNDHTWSLSSRLVVHPRKGKIVYSIEVISSHLIKLLLMI